MILSEDIKGIDKWIYCTKNSSNSYLKQKFKTRKMRSNMIYQPDTFVPSGTNNKRDVELEKQEKTCTKKRQLWSEAPFTKRDSDHDIESYPYYYIITVSMSV